MLSSPFLWITIGVLAFVIIGKYSFEDPALKGELRIISNHQDVQYYLNKHKAEIGEDYEAYRGHIYRVYTYANHFLNGDDEGFSRAISAALVYHDIGLWTDHTLAYLEPSRDRAVQNLHSTFSDEEMNLIRDIIYWHHKMTPFEGAHANIVNAVRKADWIDATRGLIHQGMPKIHIKDVVSAIPYGGFHEMLMGFGFKLYGRSPYRIISELSSILKY